MDVEYRLPNMTSTLQIIGCHLGEKPPRWSFPWHHHFIFELLYCKRGEIRQTIGAETISLNSGDWLLIKSGVPHTTENRSEAPYVFFNLHFDLDDPVIRAQLCEADYIKIEAHEPACNALSSHRQEIEQAFLRNIEAGISEGEAAIGRLLIQSHTLGIISLFAELQARFSQSSDAEAGRSPSTAFETKIAHSIEEKLRSGHYESIADIAASLGLSRGRCTHIFTKVYGQAPRQYISKLVLNRAKHLLVHTTLTIEELSEQLGFQSASHFSRQFRRWTGMPPSAYRPRHNPSITKLHTDSGADKS